MGEETPDRATEAELLEKDFGTLARERRCERGLPVPVRERMLPFPALCEQEEHAHDVTLPHLDTCQASDVELQSSARLRLALAESRMSEMMRAIIDTEANGASIRELDCLAAAYLHELATSMAVQTQLQSALLPDDR